MGGSVLGLRRRRPLLTFAAALILPLSTTTATASPTAGPQDAAPSGAELTTVSRAFDPVPFRAGAEPAVAGSAGAKKRQTVVTQTLKQRVQQVSGMSSYNLPEAALSAYQNAAAALAVSDPGCHLSWTLIAALATVESDNGQYGGAVVYADGATSPHILGPVLNGSGGFAAIRDTDGGRLDGDPDWDRAVGPMQFIPGTWAAYGADGNRDGERDPNNINDAALTAGVYLCAWGGDLRVTSQVRAAVMHYNQSVPYVDLVLSLANAFAGGAGYVVPNASGSAPNPPPSPAPRDQGSGGNGSQDNGDGRQGTHPVHHQPTHHPKPPPPPPPPVTGVLQICGSGWCLDATVLDLGQGADLSQTQGDYNGDGLAESVTAELTSLVGQTFTLTVDGAAAPGVAQLEPALTLTAGPYTITVNGDGLVTAIDGLPYEVITG
jgi:membrane-bound lytic murein transglycosylase B